MKEKSAEGITYRYPGSMEVEETLGKLIELMMTEDSGYCRDVASSAIRTIRGLLTGTNYVTDDDTHPTEIRFENGRKVWVEDEELAVAPLDGP